MEDYLLRRSIANKNFFAIAFSYFKRVELIKEGFTMGVAIDKYSNLSLLYNPEAIEKMSDEDITFVLSHEAAHVVLSHLFRAELIKNAFSDLSEESFDNIFQIATDISANQHIQEKKDKKEFVKVGKDKITILYPELFDLPKDETIEYYFSELLKKAKNQKCSGNQSVQISDLLSDSDKGGKGGKGGKDKIDDHSGWKIENNGISSDLVKMVSENKLRGIFRKALTIYRDITKHSKSRGKLPGAFEELIEEFLLIPKLPYFLLIKKIVVSRRKAKYQKSFLRLNKKMAYMFAFPEENRIIPIPGLKRNRTFKITIIIDTSGSMSKDDILEGLSGIKDVIEKDKNCLCWVIYNDTDVRKDYIVKRVKDIDFKVTGRGGTKLFPAINHAIREHKSDIMLIFTDGYCENLNSKANLINKKIIWVITKGGTAKNVDKTGYVVHVD